MAIMYLSRVQDQSRKFLISASWGGQKLKASEGAYKSTLALELLLPVLALQRFESQQPSAARVEHVALHPWLQRVLFSALVVCASSCHAFMLQLYILTLAFSMNIKVSHYPIKTTSNLLNHQNFQAVSGPS